MEEKDSEVSDLFCELKEKYLFEWFWNKIIVSEKKSRKMDSGIRIVRLKEQKPRKILGKIIICEESKNFFYGKLLLH